MGLVLRALVEALLLRGAVGLLGLEEASLGTRAVWTPCGDAIMAPVGLLGRQILLTAPACRRPSDAAGPSPGVEGLLASFLH